MATAAMGCWNLAITRSVTVDCLDGNFQRQIIENELAEILQTIFGQVRLRCRLNDRVEAEERAGLAGLDEAKRRVGFILGFTLYG